MSEPIASQPTDQPDPRIKVPRVSSDRTSSEPNCRAVSELESDAGSVGEDSCFDNPERNRSWRRGCGGQDLIEIPVEALITGGPRPRRCLITDTEPGSNRHRAAGLRELQPEAEVLAASSQLKSFSEPTQLDRSVPTNSCGGRSYAISTNKRLRCKLAATRMAHRHRSPRLVNQGSTCIQDCVGSCRRSAAKMREVVGIPLIVAVEERTDVRRCRAKSGVSREARARPRFANDHHASSYLILHLIRRDHAIRHDKNLVDGTGLRTHARYSAMNRGPPAMRRDHHRDRQEGISHSASRLAIDLSCLLAGSGPVKDFGTQPPTSGQLCSCFDTFIEDRSYLRSERVVIAVIEVADGVAADEHVAANR